LTQDPAFDSPARMGEAARPFLKWAGGKRWLAQTGILPSLSDHGRYFEPFLGSAAMFFALKPANALLSDANAAAIELYEVVRDHPDELEARLKSHERAHSHDHYYSARADMPSCKLDRAARMLYLNRTCWNGLYRVNRKGHFNVPIGTKTKVLMGDDFGAISARLKTVVIRCCDFSESMREAGKGDLIYADPPYTVRHNANGFLKYNQQIFSWDDQVRLRDAAVAASQRGATVVVSNADHDSLHELYGEIADFKRLTRPSVISGTSAARGRVTEALFVLRCSPMETQDSGLEASIPLLGVELSKA
jgi:DNA adenine methylase